MEKKQKINCSVAGCAYNDNQTQECELKEIIVEPCSEEAVGTPEDDSMCGSYEATETEEE